MCGEVSDTFCLLSKKGDPIWRTVHLDEGGFVPTSDFRQSFRRVAELVEVDTVLVEHRKPWFHPVKRPLGRSRIVSGCFPVGNSLRCGLRIPNRTAGI